MTERKRNPEEVLDEMVKKNVGFQVAELGATLIAGGASIFIATTQHAIAAAATGPLTIAIALNYYNRRQLDRLTRQQTLLDITEVQRRLSSEIQGIRGQAFEGAGNIELGNTDQFQGALASLSETVSALEMQMQQGVASAGEASHLETELVQLRNHQLEFSQSLEAIQQQLRSSPADASSTHLDSEIAALKAQMAQMQAMPMVADTSSDLDLNALRDEFQDLLNPVHQNLLDLQSRVSQSDAQNVPAAVDPDALRMEVMQLLAPVQQQVASLENRVVAQPVISSPTAGAEDLQTVHSQMSILNEKLENVAAQLSAEIAGFQKSVEQTQDRMQDVHQQVQSVHQTLATTPASPDVSVIHQEMQAAIGPLHEQMTALEQKLGSMPTVDTNVSQLQAEQMVSLQNQLNNTNGLIEEVAGQFSTELSKVTADLTKIPQLIEETIDQKLSKLQPAAPQDHKKDAMSELDSILADINL